jgi:hypothetical protein
LQIAAAAQLLSDILGDVTRPALGGVEGGDPDRIGVLAAKQVNDYGFQIGGLDIRLPLGAPFAAKIIDHEVNCLIGAVRHDRRSPIRTHTQLPTKRNTGEFKHETGNRSCQKSSIGLLARDESHLFNAERPIDRLLGCGHRCGVAMCFAHDHYASRNGRRPCPHVPPDALNHCVFDASMFHAK